MSQLVHASITIDGKEIKQFLSFTLSQEISEHHRWRLVCPAEAIDGPATAVFSHSRDMIGTQLVIRADAVGGKSGLEFSGLVTQVEAERFSGHAGNLIISGSSPTILMDSGPHCKTWEKRTLKDIAEDTVKHFPKNLLQPDIKPGGGDTMPYVVQYKETAWQLLRRLSAAGGEWFYYDGRHLRLGPPQGDKTSLIYGSSLSEFTMTMEARPAAFRLLTYDYMNAAVYESSPSRVAETAGLNDLGKHALKKSEDMYATQPRQWMNRYVTGKSQLDDQAVRKAAMQSSGMIRLYGRSGDPGVRIGAPVSVQGRNVFSLSDESFGDYTVVSVTHHCDGQGNYTNEFSAIPASVRLPPLDIPPDPYCETQSAMVTDNHDPKGLGRIRVKFHWMNDPEKSPWLRVTSPHAGGGKGMFFLPEVGEEVIVGFEGDSPNKPYVIGSVYHGKAKSDFANGGNDVKVLQSRSGNKVILNDKDGSVGIYDAKSNFIFLDGKGNIDMYATDSIRLRCGKKSFVLLDKDGTAQLIGTKSVFILGQEESAQLHSNNKVEVRGLQSTSVLSLTKIDIDAPTCTISAEANLKMQSAVVQVIGQVSTDIQGGMLNLNC